MHLFLGNLDMEKGDYERAIQSFQHAQIKLNDHKERLPLMITLVHALLPRNALKLISISYRFRGGISMILQLRFNSDCARPSL